MERCRLSTDRTALDDGTVWPTCSALKELTVRTRPGSVELLKSVVG
jgi:hypothetical protein